MSTTTFNGDDFLPLPSSTTPSAALRSLMQDWEREGVVDEEESETELMVLLSGMVGVSDATISDA